MPSFREEENFGRTVFAGILDEVIAWIGNNLNPEEVFHKDDLMEWADEHSVGDLVDEDRLEEWALENGFIKEEE